MGATAPGSDEETRHMSLEASPFGQLLALLSSSVVRRSSILTDRLLRLLSLISLGNLFRIQFQLNRYRNEHVTE